MLARGIVAYLQDGRPGTAQGRTVLVRAQAPYRALTSNAVTTVVACAGRRAGLGLISAHRLRHSAATAMLRSGGSLTEIGQTLRHARPLTTAIYANSRVLHQAGEKPQVTWSALAPNRFMRPTAQVS